MSGMSILVRSSQPEEKTAGQIPQVVAKLNKELPAYNVQPLEQKLRLSMVQEQILAVLLSAFGALALLLASIGLYSLLSYLAQTRTREIGVRMAIGATKKDILMGIVSHGFALAIFGIFTGLIFSVLVSRLVRSWLFAITPFDFWTYTTMTLLMVLTSFLASYIPARRAASVDPVRALRYE
jgi:ABC-type antimicrobial peptide transport system permease subunit